jgi:hypothetical protein
MARTPLGYVVHVDAAVAPSAQNLPGEYTTIQEEIITPGMPHTGIVFHEDNIKVCEIIWDSLHETDAYNWIKRSERCRDGRSAYLAPTTHYLGASKNETLRNQANTCLMKTFYQGEKNKFDWTRFVAVHKKRHNDLEATGPPLAEDDKVRHLLNGISIQKLDTAVPFVRSLPQLMSNFDASVDSISMVIENICETFKQPFSQVSSATSGQPDDGRGRGNRGGNGGHGGQGGRGLEAVDMVVTLVNHGLNQSRPDGTSNMRWQECLKLNVPSSVHYVPHKIQARIVKLLPTLQVLWLHIHHCRPPQTIITHPAFTCYHPLHLLPQCRYLWLVPATGKTQL